MERLSVLIGSLFTGSADSGIAEQPTMSPEARVLQEVLATETVYVHDLNEVIQVRLPHNNSESCDLCCFVLRNLKAHLAFFLGCSSHC